MKRILILYFALSLFDCAACAEGFVYTQESVTDCANTNLRYDPFYASGRLDFVIPGLKQGFVPQGLSYLAEKNWMIIAGYSGDESTNSVLFAVDLASGKMVREAMLQYADGSSYLGHAGGVAVTGKNIFISNNSHLYRISLEKFLALPDSAFCAFDEEIPVPSRASYCSYTDGVLWVGEFQYDPSYKTDRTHWYKNEDGRHKAWLIGYVLDPTQENELVVDTDATETATPDYILSTTERIQGMTIHGEKICLSQSYGRRNSSVLLRYRNVLESEPLTQVELNGTTVPLWCLNSTVLENTLVMPPASECLVSLQNGLYVLFETAAQKYMDPENPSANPMDRLFCMTEF